MYGTIKFMFQTSNQYIYIYVYIITIDIENGHTNSGFTHQKCSKPPIRQPSIHRKIAATNSAQPHVAKASRRRPQQCRRVSAKCRLKFPRNPGDLAMEIHGGLPCGKQT